MGRSDKRMATNHMKNIDLMIYRPSYKTPVRVFFVFLDEASSVFHVVDAPHGSLDAAEFRVIGFLSEDESGESPRTDDSASSTRDHASLHQQLGTCPLGEFRPVAKVFLGLIPEIIGDDSFGDLNAFENSSLWSDCADQSSISIILTHPSVVVSSDLLLFMRRENVV